MIDPSAFAAVAYQAWARELARALGAHPRQVLERVVEQVPVSRYDTADLPFTITYCQEVPFRERFATIDAFLAEVLAGTPCAAEAGLLVLRELDLDRALAMAEAVRQMTAWPILRTRAAQTLSWGTTEAAFRELLALVPDRDAAPPSPSVLLCESRFPHGCEIVLKRLLESPVLHYESIVIPSVSEWARMSQDDREASERRWKDAAARLAYGDIYEADAFIQYLGERHCAGAAALIAQLYAEHPSEHVRLATGHALVDLGDPTSLAQLVTFIDSSDRRRRWFAAKGLVGRDPAHATELLEPESLRPHGEDFPALVFQVIDNDARLKKRSGKPRWVDADPRWLEVMATWAVKGEVSADHALMLFSEEEQKRALARAREERRKQQKAARKPRRPSQKPGAAIALLEKGDLPGAWRKLGALGEYVREPPYSEDARRIAELTMRRASECLKRIVERLEKAGYRFEFPKHAYLPPPKDAAEQLDELESIAGPLPLSYRAALEHLGACSLAGDHPDWPKTANVALRPAPSEEDVWLTDPLVLIPVDVALDTARDLGRTGAPFELAFAGDPLAKAGFSGGNYRIGVPCASADAVVLGDAKGRTFLEYLRASLRFGGFAGFASIRKRPQALIDALVAGCEPF